MQSSRELDLRDPNLPKNLSDLGLQATGYWSAIKYIAIDPRSASCAAYEDYLDEKTGNDIQRLLFEVRVGEDDYMFSVKLVENAYSNTYRNSSDQANAIILEISKKILSAARIAVELDKGPYSPYHPDNIPAAPVPPSTLELARKALPDTLKQIKYNLSFQKSRKISYQNTIQGLFTKARQELADAKLEASEATKIQNKLTKYENKNHKFHGTDPLPPSYEQKPQDLPPAYDNPSSSPSEPSVRMHLPVSEMKESFENKLQLSESIKPDTEAEQFAKALFISKYDELYAIDKAKDLFPSYQLNPNQSLENILLTAKNDTRGRKACIKLEWMNISTKEILPLERILQTITESNHFRYGMG